MKFTRFARAAMIAAAAALASVPVAAQEIRSVDPNAEITAPAAPASSNPMSDPSSDASLQSDLATSSPAPAPASQPQSGTALDAAKTEAAAGKTYQKDDVLGAAEGVFGKGAKGLADIVEKVLKEQGQPNAYIAGREASGAFVVGLRYGSGTLSHTVEGQRPVYWTGPSLGFDVGGDAAKVFVLVYNLYDSQDLYKRYGQVEGRAYFVGGFSATYLRRGNVALIPIRLGVGVRLGANVGYMKFSEKSKWLPF